MAPVFYTTPFISSSSTTVWQNLNYTYATGGSITNASTSYTLAAIQWGAFNTAYEENAEQRAERERQQALLRDEQIARQRERDREWTAANKLAEDLLMACLSPEQARDHVERKYFDVTGSRGNLYRIRTGGHGQSGNVILIDEGGRHQARYCVHPPDFLPNADAWLAQKLALEADEDTVLAVANLSWRTTGHVDIRPDARTRAHQRQLELVGGQVREVAERLVREEAA